MSKNILRTVSEDKADRERLHVRTRELAVLAGRRSLDITQGDYEQAKRECRNPEATHLHTPPHQMNKQLLLDPAKAMARKGPAIESWENEGGV